MFETKEEQLQASTIDAMIAANEVLAAKIKTKSLTTDELVNLSKSIDNLAVSVFGYQMASKHLDSHDRTSRSALNELRDMKRRQNGED